jgi:hypothetical protein
MQQIYEGITHDWQLSDYQDWRDLFDALSVIFDSDEETEHFWDMYLRSFYLTSRDEHSIPRETFYRESQIPRSQIDWEDWRDVMGYGKRK